MRFFAKCRHVLRNFLPDLMHSIVEAFTSPQAYRVQNDYMEKYEKAVAEQVPDPLPVTPTVFSGMAPSGHLVVSSGKPDPIPGIVVSTVVSSGGVGTIAPKTPAKAPPAKAAPTPAKKSSGAPAAAKSPKSDKSAPKGGKKRR